MGGRLKHACMHAKLIILLVSVTVNQLRDAHLLQSAASAKLGRNVFSGGTALPVNVRRTAAAEQGMANVPAASVLPFVSVSLGTESVAWLAFSTTKAALKQKWKERFPMLWVGDKSALVEVVVEERRQGLAEEDVCHHQPPG